MGIRKALYQWAVKKANRHANANEGIICVSHWDELAAFLWKEGFDD